MGGRTLREVGRGKAEQSGNGSRGGQNGEVMGWEKDKSGLGRSWYGGRGGLLHRPNLAARVHVDLHQRICYCRPKYPITPRRLAPG